MVIMIIQFVKDEGLPIVLCGHQHMPLQYRKRTSSSETVCELRFGVLSKNDSYLTSVSPKVIPLQGFGMCGYPQI